MNKSRKRTPTKAPVPPKHWMDIVRIGLLIEAVVLAGFVIYLRFFDDSPRHLQAILATAMMLLWVIAPIMIGYYAARPRRKLMPRITWGLTAFVGGLVMIWYLLGMIRGEGGSTAALGLLVLPFYLFLAMLVAQLIPLVLNMIRRGKL